METPHFTSVQISRDALSGYIAGFLDSFGDERTQTRATYDGALREFVRWFDTDRRFGFAVDDVCRYKDYLSKLKKLTPASISTYLSALRQFCEYLLQRDVITINPARYIRSYVSRSADRFNVLTKAEVDRLIGLLDQTSRRTVRDSAIIHLMLEHGLSETELVRLDVKDYVSVTGSGVLRLRGTGNERRVLLGQDMTALMDRYLASRSNPKDCQPFFLSDGNRTRGMRMTTRGIRARVNHYLGMAGIKNTGSRKITPHILKNTAAFLLAEVGASADEIKYRMRFGSLAKARKYVQQVNPAV